MPAWLASQGLFAYEYQLTHGVNITETTARLIGGKAKEAGVAVSVHAPYYISLATDEETTAANTKQHFLKSLQAAEWLGADRIAFHMGGIGKKNRREAMELAKRRMTGVLEEAAKLGLTGPKLAAETHGKMNQLGTIEEIIELCRLSDQLIPTVDFAHMYAVAGGGYASPADFGRIFETIAEALGSETAASLHIHFSRIEFTKAGEKRHWSFGDAFGPPHEPLLEYIAAQKIYPRIICESAGTQAEDAKTMQDFYEQLRNT